MKSVSLVLILASVTFSNPSLAESREERLAAAQEYILVSLEEMDVPALVRVMWKPIADQSESRGTPLDDEQIAALDSLYQQTFADALENLLRSQDETMADLFTLKEIEALAAFYATPEGRAVMRKMPELAQAQQTEIQSLIAGGMALIQPRVKAILRGDK
ncbi:DUF2059 domain-containing protein [Nitratireductor thuwali]|uniref:DUF2059 domain-containing protein n=1 Tax=Nitratireductor thuwali TaxID=2267699 RepID=UPI0030D2D461